MKHDFPPRIDPVLNLARNQMEQVSNIHCVHLAIVSGKDETQLLQFDDAAFDEMMHQTIPALIHEIRALGVIVSSPAMRGGRCGAVVTLVDRAIEAFYAPIVRMINADTLVGDFRPSNVAQPEIYGRIHTELSVNWLRRGDE